MLDDLSLPLSAVVAIVSAVASLLGVGVTATIAVFGTVLGLLVGEAQFRSRLKWEKHQWEATDLLKERVQCVVELYSQLVNHYWLLHDSGYVAYHLRQDTYGKEG